MADIGTLTPEQYQQQQLNRQQKMAELLMAQGSQGQPAGQMVSGRYVPNSWAQNLLPVAQMLTGAYLGKKGDEESLKLAEQLRGKEAQAVQDYMAALNPAQTELAGPTPTNAPLMTQNQPDYAKAFAAATSRYAPAPLQAAGYKMLEPITTKEGEKVIQRNLGGGGFSTIAEGAPKYHAPTSVDMGTLGTMLIYPDGRREMVQKGREGPAGQVVETANGPMLVNTRTGQAQPVMANGQPIIPKLSPEQSKDITAINQQTSTIDGALQAVKANPTAFSFARGSAQALPSGESIAGRFDKPAEAEARAYVFNNVSAVIKERAGTAQSASEMQRINSFMPSVTDNSTQIENKLKGFKTYLKDLEKGTRVNPNMPMQPQTPQGQQAPQIDPKLLQYMTPEQRKLFGG